MINAQAMSGRPSATALIATKYRPPATGRAVMRSRLLDLLDGAASDGRQIVLIAAPAGSGKTTLLVSLAEATARPVAWLTLDDDENDPTRFLNYLLAAIDRAVPGCIDVIRNMAASEYPPPTNAMLTELVNALDRSEPLLLVLDDYHAITFPAVDEITGFLIDYLPGNVQLAIASRTEPNLPLARARSRGRLLDINLDDLRFTGEETSGLVSRWLGRSMSGDELSRLQNRTEGWAAGLAAALSLARRRPGDIADALAASELQLTEYLIDETITCLDPRLREFLVKLSIVDRLSDGIAEQVTGFSDSRELLDEAQRGILFIAPLDEDRRFRRFHALFAQALRAWLERSFSEELPELHRRAARWFAENGDDASALTHALEAGETDLAASIVLSNAKELMAHGEFCTVRNWIERLPPSSIEESVEINLIDAWALAQSGELDAAELRLARIVSEGADDSSRLAGEIAAIHSRISVARDDPQGTIRRARQALELMPAATAPHRGGVMLNLGHALSRLGDLEGAIKAFGDAAALGPAAGPMIAALGLRYQAGIEIARGQLGAATQLYRRAHALIVSRGYADAPAAGIIIEGLADLAYHRNELDEAMRLSTDARRRGEQGGEIKIIVPANVLFGKVLAARGDLEGAITAIERGIALSHWPSTIAWRARMLLRSGDLAGAQQWAIDSGCNRADSIEDHEEFVMVTYVRVLDAIGRDRERDLLLASLHERAVRLNSVTARIELETLQSLAAAASGRSDEATALLLPALRSGEDSGHVRLFLDEGARIGPLLARAERAISGDEGQPTVGFVARLRALLVAELPPPDRADEAEIALIEPLTPREREVLRLIADGRSNQAIADELFLSIGSVKSHSSHLYGKLGVRGRTEAVARARSLGLIA